jgi:dTDP-4-amino-4,6-dideoxygalactose transaminase
MLAEKLQLIRNHGEAVVGGKEMTDLTNMVGYNFRLGEIECAIGIEQLKKLEGLVSSRQDAADKLTSGLTDLVGLKTPVVRPGCTHAYYVYPMQLDIRNLNVPRARIIEALQAEGVGGLMEGYTNLHLLPIYQRKTAYGSRGFPWSSDICRRDVNYAEGICPVAEALHHSTYLGIQMCMFRMEGSDIDAIVRAFRKVWENIELLEY